MLSHLHCPNARLSYDTARARSSFPLLHLRLGLLAGDSLTTGSGPYLSRRCLTAGLGYGTAHNICGRIPGTTTYGIIHGELRTMSVVVGP